MTTLQSSTFSGTEKEHVRPGADTKTATATEIAKDQAYLWESITNVKSPDATAIAATAHIHDGTTGVVPPIPIAEGYLGAVFPPQDPSVAFSEGFDPVIWVPMYIPPGVTEVDVVLYTGISVVDMDTVKCVFVSELEVEEEYPKTGVQILPGDPLAHNRVAFRYRLKVTPSSNCILKILVWDSAYRPSGAAADGPILQTRTIDSWGVYLPIDNVVPVPEYRVPNVTSTNRSIPTTFQSIDDQMVQDDRGWSSVLATWMAANDALMWEVAFGQPAGNRATATRSGHNHVDAGLTSGGSSLDDSGAHFSYPLGSYAYGSMRTKVSADANRMSIDETNTPLTQPFWTGNIYAPNFLGAKTGYQLLTRHRLRLPRLKRADAANLSGKVNGAIWVYKNDATVDLNVKVIGGLGDASTTDGSPSVVGAANTDSWLSGSGTGRKLMLLPGIDLENLDSTGNDPQSERIVTLSIYVQATISGATCGKKKVGVYGSCFWIG